MGGVNMWKQQMVVTKRGVFEVFIKGKGAPLCVTHHYSTFNKSGDYFAEVFTSSYKVFLINLREAGHSERMMEPYQLSMVETIYDLEAIRTACGLSKWGFAGHSTGGMLGVLYGIHYSQCLSCLILVGAAAREYASNSLDCIYHNQHPSYKKMQQLLNKITDVTLTAEERGLSKVERTKLSLFYPSKYHEYFNREIRKDLNRRRLAFFSREVKIFDVTKQLYRIQTPTFILCGRHDVQCPVNYSIEMAELIPSAHLKLFEESNHYPFLEEPTLFKQEVLKFNLQ